MKMEQKMLPLGLRPRLLGAARLRCPSSAEGLIINKTQSEIVDHIGDIRRLITNKENIQ